MMDLKKTIRSRADEISEMRIRLDMAEKRLATSGKEGDERVVRLQRRWEQLQQDLKKKERSVMSFAAMNKILDMRGNQDYETLCLRVYESILWMCFAVHDPLRFGSGNSRATFN